MEIRTILVLLGLLVTPFATAGEAYVWTDDDGVVHYSDRPVPGARKIELAEPNTGQSPAPRRPEATSGEEGAEPAEDATEFRYESLEIASPGAEETLWNIGGALNVSLALSPPLQPGHQVRVYFNGNAQMKPGTSFQINEVWRGVHNLQAEILDETGRMLIRSRASRFYVQQNSVL
jgi:hypothetical protein